MTDDNRDRLSEILEGHLELTKRQLELYREGLRLEDNIPGFPKTEQELLRRIEHLEASLARRQQKYSQ